MVKYVIDFNTARELHRLGDLKKAKSAYLALLRNKPRDSDILHALGILFTQEENFPKAIEYLEKAHAYQPRDPSIASHLANVFKFQGLFAKARALLEKTLLAYPDYLPALNNLANVYFAEENFDLAIACYEKAIAKKPDYIDAYYNLGLTYLKKNLLQNAKSTFKKILEMIPDHFAARFQLACIHMRYDQLKEAIYEFLIIENTHAYHFETQTNLATCYLKQGEMNEAKKHYLKALELRPGDTQILFNLGVLSSNLHQVDAAIQYYQRLLVVNPNLFAAQNNIAVAFLAKNHIAYALAHFKEALRLQPHNESIQYIVKSLSQNERLTHAPKDYIQSLFDAYADHYEPHLLSTLEYKIPKIFASVIPAKAEINILDLGCGTGLCGEVFKSRAKSLIGVDLSEKMLEVARQKNIYDELLHMDLQDFLQKNTRTFDLILAGDVLVYSGDLENIFTMTHQALAMNGIFIFNAEICDEGDYQMNQSGRFSHHKDYLEALIAKNHFKKLHYQICLTRTQNLTPVQGHLYVLLRVV